MAKRPKKPIRSGWYWFDDDDGPELVDVLSETEHFAVVRRANGEERRGVGKKLIFETRAESIEFQIAWLEGQRDEVAEELAEWDAQLKNAQALASDDPDQTMLFGAAEGSMKP